MLKKELLRLLEEDREFRLMVAGFLGYRDVLERLEEHDKKFNEILERLDRHTKLLEEHGKRLEEHDKKFNEILERLDRHTKLLEEHGKRLEEHDKKFNEILGEIRRLREDFTKLSRRVEVTIGSMGRRWGLDLERTVLEIFREALEKRGIELGKVEKFKFKDLDGSVTGVKGRIVDVDALVKDDKVYVIEIKSRAELEHVEMLPNKVKVVERVLGKPVAKTFIVTVNIDREAYERARELGVEILYGNILE